MSDEWPDRGRDALSADPIRFLIVDDIPGNMVALEALLRREGVVIDMAASAREALELLLVHDYALAFLDVQMPETDGYELAELMRGAERTRGVPIIFLTAADRDERRRFRGYEAGAVDYIFKPVDPLVLTSKAEVFFRLGRQARELARQRDEMRQLARLRDQAITRLRAHADNSPLALVECDSRLVVQGWSQGAERIFGRPAATMLGRPLAGPGWLAPEGVALLSGWLADGNSRARHSGAAVALRADGAQVECEVHGSILADPGTGALSLSLQILDVTERRQAERIRSLLVGELNHRIRNTLANVQAIARQTLRQSTDLAQFQADFGGRLQALAQAHSLLSDATWTGASLDGLIDASLRVGTLDPARLRRSGPSVQLSPENTLRLALSLHELATNAAKYGALSRPQGAIRLDWEVDGPTLTLRWSETGGPPVSPPAREGFGTTLIRSSAGGADQAVSAEWRPEGVVWTIRLPHAPGADRLAEGLRPPAPTGPMAAECPAQAGTAMPAASGASPAAPPAAGLAPDAAGGTDCAPSRSASPPPRPAAPAAPAASLRPAPAPAADPAGAARARIGGSRVLVIEDEPLVALDISEELRAAGAGQVAIARTVGQALEAIGAQPIDIALLDGNLGGEPVDEVARALERRGIPFCFVSGYGREHLPGPFAHVPVIEKPFRTEALLPVLGRLMERAEPARDAAGVQAG